LLVVGYLLFVIYRQQQTTNNQQTGSRGAAVRPFGCAQDRLRSPTEEHRSTGAQERVNSE